MKRVAWALALLTVSACSSSSGAGAPDASDSPDGGSQAGDAAAMRDAQVDASGRFSGSSCASLFVPDQPTTTACDGCGAAMCATACVGSACGDYYTCLCACDVADMPCRAACQDRRTSACNMCVLSLLSCRNRQCGTACTRYDPDAAASTGACGEVAACCPRLPTVSQANCQQVVQAGNQTTCAGVLPVFRDAGVCP